MLRRYFLAVISLMIIGLIVYGYVQFKRYNTPVSPILMAVPEGSAIVLETENALSLWEKLTHTSVIWEDLKRLSGIEQIDVLGLHIDSVLQNDAELKNEMMLRKAMLAVVPSGAQRFDLLFAINTSPNWTEEKVNKVIGRFIPKNAQRSERMYDETTIYKAVSDKKQTLYWAHKSGILLISMVSIPIEDALRTLESPVNLLNRSDFQKVAKTAGLYADANVYIDHREVGRFFQSFLNQTGQKSALFAQPMAGWSALDLTLKSNQIMLNGFVHVADSSDQYFNVFAGQKPQETQVTRIIPSNTAFLMYFGLSHFPTYYKRYQDALRRQKAFFSYDKSRDALNQKINGNAEEYCLSWIGSEMAVFITEPNYGSYDQLTYLALQSKDVDKSLKLLQELSEALDFPVKMHEMVSHQVIELKLDNTYGQLLGAPFEGFDEVFVTAIGDYVVFAQTRSAMRNLLNFNSAENTLHKDKNFNSFMSNLGKRSNLLLYSGVSRSPDLYMPFLTTKGKNILEGHLEMVRNFEGVAYQLVQSKDDMLYTNMYLRHNPVYTRESGAFWELTMASGIVHGPQLLMNHYTNSREILVQDSTQNIHLISNTGKVLWSRKIDGVILGRVQQIDLYKNQKLQMLFNTASHIHLIDRNGNNVSGYPVKLPAKATAPLGLFDYDQSRDYRLLIPCADRSLRMYDGAGKVVKGWKGDITGNVVSDKPEHLRLGNKDYIFVADEGGAIYLLNRQGKPRHKVKSKIEARSDNPLFVVAGKNIKQTELLYTDTLGNLVSIGFDDDVQKTSIAKPQPHHFAYLPSDDENRQQIVIVTAHQVMLFDREGDQQCGFSGDDLLSQPVSFSTRDNNSAVGVLSASEEAIYLLNAQCETLNEFPLFARGSFVVGDINKDGVLNVVAVGENRTIYTYNLE